MIHQVSIPAMPGNNGFANKKVAASVAEPVMQKIKKGEMPPTTSIKELNSPKAIHWLRYLIKPGILIISQGL